MSISTCLIFAVGYIAGLVVGLMIPRKIDGYFRIDTSAPDKDLYSLDLAIPLEEVNKAKKLSFKVVHISQN